MCSSTARHSTAHAARRPLRIGAIVLLGACANADAPSPLAPSARDAAPGTALADEAATTAAPDVDAAIRTLRRATASYQNLDNAIADGFVLLHDCEVRPEEGAVGTVYVNVARLLDGTIDPTRPDALIYEPSDDGRLALVGAEFAIPYTMWSDAAPPQFAGATFQREDEFGVYALHAWVWRQNPHGIFAETNPRVSCAG